MPQSNRVALKVQSLSGFDKSFYHDLTANVGSLVPALFDECIPSSIVNLNVAASVQLPPLASDAFAKVDLKLEAFAIPLRILYGGFEKFFADDSVMTLDYDGPAISDEIPFIPKVVIGSDWDDVPQVFGKGSLSDYLGLKLGSNYYASAEFSMLPYLAYAKVYDDWYRSVLVQQQLFSDGIGRYTVSLNGVANMPFLAFESGQESFLYGYDADNTWMYFINGTTLFDLRPRNYGFDYFTNAWPKLQFGTAMTVQVDGNDQFSIAALRAANSLQQFEERNQFAPRYYQALKARYGASVHAGIVQRPVFLGSATIPIKTYGVDVNADNAPNGGSPTNPFSMNAGAQLGRARGEGFVNLIDNYHVDEPSYIMVVASVVPRAVYSSGVSRLFDRYIREGGIAEMATPILQNTGNQPIYPWELNGHLALGHTYAFGYTDRFADWMTCPDRISGNLREGGNLQSFVLKRNFEDSSTPVISSSFLEIPATALDEISATETAISEFGAWMQFGFDYKVVQPLALYSIPSLQDPAYEHGKTVEVERGGFRF